MDYTVEPATRSVGVPNRSRLFEDIRARLTAITDSLADYKLEAGQLRTSTQELLAVAHRIEWLADISNVPVEGP